MNNCCWLINVKIFFFLYQILEFWWKLIDWNWCLFYFWRTWLIDIHISRYSIHADETLLAFGYSIAIFVEDVQTSYIFKFHQTFTARTHTVNLFPSYSIVREEVSLKNFSNNCYLVEQTHKTILPQSLSLCLSLESTITYPTYYNLIQ